MTRAVAPQLIFHERGNTVTIPRSQLLDLAAAILRGFPDLQFRVESVIASGDSAAARITATGTHRGEWDGIAPTGRRVQFDEMFFCRLRDGRLAECWEVWDKWGLRQQLLANSG
jgi:predicted ester cyclase